MGIWDRLGNVIKSYISSEDERVFGSSFKRHSDPDLDAAYEELDEFLNKGTSAQSDPGRNTNEKQERAQKKQRPVPEDIRKDFAELGLTPDATVEECKEAYKRLLKIHHPDRHAKHEGNMKKATDKTTRVNAAYERLMEWFKKSTTPP